MQTVITPFEKHPAPPRMTTLYDLIAALQAAVAPEEDDIVVATVVSMLHSGRIIFQDAPSAGHAHHTFEADDAPTRSLHAADAEYICPPRRFL